jgi:hypothetical protein
MLEWAEPKKKKLKGEARPVNPRSTTFAEENYYNQHL